MRAAAVSTSQAALASTRIAPDGPSASRTASTRARSSAARLPRLGHLHLRRRAARRRHDRVRPLGVDRRHGHVHRHRVAQRGGPALDGGLERGGPPAAALGDVVVPERGELAPAGRPADEHAVPDVDAAEAGAQRHRVDPRLQHRPGGGGDHDRQRSSAGPYPCRSWPTAPHPRGRSRPHGRRPPRRPRRRPARSPSSPPGRPRWSPRPVRRSGRRSRWSPAPISSWSPPARPGRPGGPAVRRRAARLGGRDPRAARRAGELAAGPPGLGDRRPPGALPQLLAGIPATVPAPGRAPGRRGRPHARRAAATPPWSRPSSGASWTPSRTRCAPSTRCSSAAPPRTPPCSPAPAAHGVPVVTTYGMTETAGGCVYDGGPLDGVAVRVTDGDRAGRADPRARLPARPGGDRGRLRRTAGSAPATPARSTRRPAHRARPARRRRHQRRGERRPAGRRGGAARAPGRRRRRRRSAGPTRSGGSGSSPPSSPPPGAPPTSPYLRAWVADRLGAPAAPRALLLLDGLPLLHTGKPDRRAVAERVRG